MRRRRLVDGFARSTEAAGLDSVASDFAFRREI